MINKSDNIYIAGHRGMVGSACWRALETEGYTNLVGKSSKELDLRDQKAVEEFIRAEQPVAIIDAAAKVGGILANDTYPYEFLMDNMLIQNNLIRSAHENDVAKFIFLGSSCIYPKFAPQPLKEEYLLTDSLEPTNEWYAIAKITGVKIFSDPTRNLEYAVTLPEVKTADAPKAEGKKVTAFVDPYSGKLIELYTYGDSYFYTIMALHRWLLGDDIGKLIMGVATLLFLFIIKNKNIKIVHI